jgi:hypothetical protein
MHLPSCYRRVKDPAPTATPTESGVTHTPGIPVTIPVTVHSVREFQWNPGG